MKVASSSSRRSDGPQLLWCGFVGCCDRKTSRRSMRREDKSKRYAACCGLVVGETVSTSVLVELERNSLSSAAIVARGDVFRSAWRSISCSRLRRLLARTGLTCRTASYLRVCPLAIEFVFDWGDCFRFDCETGRGKSSRLWVSKPFAKLNSELVDILFSVRSGP